jgi:hypothetical protein
MRGRLVEARVGETAEGQQLNKAVGIIRTPCDGYRAWDKAQAGAGGQKMSKHLDLWLEGWRRGDAAMILESITDDFVYDDPIDGRFTGADFADYLAELFPADADPRVAAEGFETISDIVVVERDGEETAWGWWKAPPFEGAGLVKARPDGVYLEKLAYYTLPESP